MKNPIITAIPNFAKVCVLAGMIGLVFIKTSAAESIQPGVSFQVFYDELLPYGDWISDPVHGYVWVPYAGPDFQPYASNGYWVMSNYGNTWVSNYDWGWAPFHYGRWYFDDYLGWAWVPGYEWGPAWVNWRSGGDYYGWAPLMPGISIQVAINIPSNYWVFVPRRRLISRNIYNYYIPRNNVYRIYNQTTVINNTYVYNNRTYVTGPHRREVERVTRRSVPVYRVSNSDRPGRASVRRNTLAVYQPAVRQTATTDRSTQARPSRVVTAREHKAAMVSRSSTNRSNVRTAPANSRTNRSRETETIRNNPATRQRETNSPIQRTNTNTASPDNYRRTAPSTRSGNPRIQTTENPQVNTRQERKIQSSPTPQSSTVRQRAQTPRQVSPARQSSSRTQSMPDRSSNRVKSTQPQRNSSASRVSSGSSRERSSGNTSRSSSPSRRSRGNN